MAGKNYKVKKAVILAGGKGTRLYPITREIPKPLLPVARKPILSHLVDLFYSHGVKNVALLVNRDFRDDFEWWQKRHHPDKKITIFEETEPLGTFGGLHFLRDWAGKDHFFLSNGDELKDIDLEKMAKFHLERNPVGTIALVRVPDAHNYGVVLCKGDFATNFLEKPLDPPSKYINSGLYLLSPKIFDYHQGPRFAMIEKDIFPQLAKEGKLAGFKFRGGRWTDCGTWERYEQALKEWGEEKRKSQSEKQLKRKVQSEIH